MLLELPILSRPVRSQGPANDPVYALELVGERTVSISEGQSVLDASLAAGIPFHHACGGRGKCTTCRVVVVEGEEFIANPNPNEQASHPHAGFPPSVRQACQMKVSGGPVKVERIIRANTEVGLWVDKGGSRSRPMGQERKLGLFFLDVRDFTPFVEAHLPFDVMHVMGQLFSIFRQAIESNGGSIIETAGDGFYAVFGLDSPFEQVAQSAVKAGQMILQRVEQANEDYFEPYFGHRFQVGIGLHVGKVIVGKVGLGVNNNMTVMGYAVNVASRLQTATKQLDNSFIISEQAYQLLSHPPRTVEARHIDLKGIRERVKVYLLGQPYEADLPLAS